jgi:hypothetical protein
VTAQIGRHLQLPVAERAHGERHLLAGEPRDQRRVVHGVHAVFDPAHRERVQRLLH